MKTVGIRDNTHRELKKIAKMNDLDMGGFVEASVQYFKRTGEDPMNPRESPKAALEEMNKRLSQVIAFIKAQERETLLPLIDNTIQINKRVEMMLEDKDLLKINDNIKGFANHLQEQKKEYQETLNNVTERQAKLYQSFGMIVQLLLFQKGIVKNKQKEAEILERLKQTFD